MALSTKTTEPDAAPARREWSIEKPGTEIPSEARSLQSGALMLVVTDDGRSQWSERTRRAAIDLAREIGARILFYDRSAESRFVNVYSSGPLTADSEWSKGERMLEPTELYALGRGYLVRAVNEAASVGVEARAWLPSTVGRAAIAEAVNRFGVDLVVAPAELRQSLSEARRRFWERRVPPLTVPILVASPDGSLRDWQLATELSRVEFTARQFGFLVVRGQFADFEVRLNFDEARPESTRVEAHIRTASLSTGLGIRDADLRSHRYFDVDRFPEMSFVSSRVERAGDDYTIVGDLEIKGIRREVVLHGRFHGIGVESGYRRATLEASGVIDRRDWSLTGGPMIGDTIRLTIEAVAVRASAG